MFLNKKFFILLLLIVIVLTQWTCQPGLGSRSDPPELWTTKALTETNRKFILTFYPYIVQANKKVMTDRARLLDLRNDYRHVVHKKNHREWINQLADYYEYGEGFFNDSLTRREYKRRIDTMLYRVDYIPERLIMAQAIVESGWGKSKFARQGNNYFGIRCYRPGCGMAPDGVDNPRFYVRAFPTLQAAVDEYLNMLNSGFAYENLRKQRCALRSQKDYPDALLMAQGLKRYSEKKSAYIDLVESIINDYLPENLQEYVEYHNNFNNLADEKS
jgi:Bax protein